jgi:ribosomal protein L14
MSAAGCTYLAAHSSIRVIRVIRGSFRRRGSRVSPFVLALVGKALGEEFLEGGAVAAVVLVEEELAFGQAVDFGGGDRAESS